VNEPCTVVGQTTSVFCAVTVKLTDSPAVTVFAVGDMEILISGFLASSPQAVKNNPKTTKQQNTTIFFILFPFLSRQTEEDLLLSTSYR
jgi:hypothetical protein